MSIHPLFIALLCLAVCLLTGFLVAMMKSLTNLGHIVGVLASSGFVLSGLTGIVQPTVYASLNHALFPFVTLSFRMNALSGFFVMLVGLVGLFATIYGTGYVREYRDRGRKSVSLLVSGVLIFLATMIAVVLAGNVFTFLVAWESMAIISFLLVIYEHENREVQRAGFIYVAMTHIGTVFLTISFLLIAFYSHSFSFQDMNAAHMPVAMKTLVFLFTLVGFGTKAGLIPLHIWLPRAHPVAPSHVSALMSGVMIKIALYGFILVNFQFLAGGPLWWGILTACVGAVTALLGILQALGQRHWKRMLAFSSIENMGIIFLGVGISLILISLHELQLAAFALLASLVHTFNHALFKSVLFLGAGAVLSKTHTQDMDGLGGLIRSMPWTAAFTFIASLAISAMPPLNGFVGEWMLFQSGFNLASSTKNPWLTVFAVLMIGALTMTGALVAMAFVRSFGTTFLAVPRSEAARDAQEVDWFMRAGMAGLAVLCILTGVFSTYCIRVFSRIVQAVFGTGPTSAGLATPGMLGGIESGTLRSAYNGANNGLHNAIHRGIYGQISMLSVFAIIVLVLILLWLVIRFGSGKTQVVTDETWACGGTLTARMTYTASGYSKPIRIAFQRILQPSRSLSRVEGGVYFPSRLTYVSILASFAETHVYQPIVRVTVQVARIVRGIQNGQVQSYLAYLFITLIVVLLIVR